MSHEARRQIREDLDLIERFASAYRERFAQVIDKLNTAPTVQTANDSLRLCVETLNMLLVTEGALAHALRHLTAGPMAPRRARAA
jgi:hypothetical protein